MSEALFKLLTGIGGLSGVASLVICWLAYRLVMTEKDARTKETEERRKLTRKVEELEVEKFQKLEKRMEDHLAADQSQKILTKLEEMEKRAGERQRNIDKSLELLTSKVDRALQTIESHATRIQANHEYIDNLREDLQTHINNTAQRRK